jgi:ABC-type sugar transport system ATPase subunit
MMKFRQQMVLRDIRLEIPRGQTLAVIGESGCGKTVLLKLMIGLLRPSRGVVRFDGRDLASLSEYELNKTRLRFGFLFQMAALFDSLTIFDNVAFGPREHNLYDPKPSIASSPNGSWRSACPRASSRRSRPSCPGASASASAWRGPWRWTPRSCFTTSRPPGSTRS